jgi:hypothetical protein
MPHVGQVEAAGTVSRKWYSTPVRLALLCSWTLELDIPRACAGPHSWERLGAAAASVIGTAQVMGGAVALRRQPPKTSRGWPSGEAPAHEPARTRKCSYHGAAHDTRRRSPERSAGASNAREAEHELRRCQLSGYLEVI